MKDFIARLLGALGLTVPADKQAEYERMLADAEGAQVTSHEAPPAEASVSEVVRRAVAAAAAPLRTELDKISQVLGEERTRREAAEKALADRNASENQKRVTDLIESAVKDGRIKPGDEATKGLYTKLATQDYDAIKSIIESLPSTTSSTQTKPGSQTETQNQTATNANRLTNGSEMRAAAAAAFSN